MNCDAVRHSLYAYAEGQLSDGEHRELAAHVAACAACRGLIEEHRTLRSALLRYLHAIPVPQVLRQKIHAVIHPERASASPAIPPAAWSRPATRYLSRPRVIAVAACLAIAAVGGWRYGISPEEAPVPGTTLAVLAATKHEQCCALCAAHHERGLPQECAQVASAIDGHFGNLIHALAPDLSAHGFKFESANYCGIRGPECTYGGHVVYVKGGDAPVRFSVFSVHRDYVPNAPEVDRCQRGLSDGKTEPGFLDVQVKGRAVCVAMWHQESTYYFCCGEIPAGWMSSLVAGVQLALDKPRTREMFAMLSDGHGSGP